MADAFGIAWSLVKAGVSFPPDAETALHNVANLEEERSGVQAQDFDRGHTDLPGALGRTHSHRVEPEFAGDLPPTRSYVHPNEIIANILGLNDISELDRELTPQEDTRAVRRIGEVSSHEAMHQALRQHRPELGLRQESVNDYSDEFGAALGEASTNWQGEDNRMRQAQPKRHLNHLHGIFGGRGESASFATDDPQIRRLLGERKAMLRRRPEQVILPRGQMAQELREHLGRRAQSNARRRGGSPEGPIWEMG